MSDKSQQSVSTTGTNDLLERHGDLYRAMQLRRNIVLPTSLAILAIFIVVTCAWGVRTIHMQRHETRALVERANHEFSEVLHFEGHTLAILTDRVQADASLLAGGRMGDDA